MKPYQLKKFIIIINATICLFPLMFCFLLACTTETFTKRLYIHMKGNKLTTYGIIEKKTINYAGIKSKDFNDMLMSQSSVH